LTISTNTAIISSTQVKYILFSISMLLLAQLLILNSLTLCGPAIS